MFKFTVVAAAALAATSAVSAAQIGTPAAITQCQPVLLNWTGAQGKVYVSVIPGSQPSAAPLVTFAPQDAGTTSLRWVPNLPANTPITLAISDDSGVQSYSGQVTIRAGTDTSCLNSNASAAASGSADTTNSGSSSGSGSGSSSSSSSSGSSGSGSSSSSPSSSGRPAASSSSSPSSQQTGSSSNTSGATSFRADTGAFVTSGLAVAAAAIAIFA
ncbi:hypothetical protein PSEUBRA_006315 [Kalmanozyma brasiliensis GHG001]|uniref:Uncharacterized protein n=1 Tax=Kalmanozyma brasiliensis (strain GHG001) TaxID=1365824 RepID=V5ENS3_KALBG|nr:uncharacterized protein PSEUBRA_006315 [Kalmanozyma brasiliensis GHG001]EST04568.1 hypothetical protein PSEUBRA_006315 [Kalmanozyma brasiliensis GHG001]